MRQLLAAGMFIFHRRHGQYSIILSGILPLFQNILCSRQLKQWVGGMKSLVSKTNSHLTAISRKTLPSPVKWLINHSHLSRCFSHKTTLDYGCGKCEPINPPSWFNYDPRFHNDPTVLVENFYQLILCTYVLCTLTAAERMPVLKQIQNLLSEDGIAYISVRSDRPAQGWGVSKKGTYQGRVRKLNLPLVYKNSQFRIYQLTKTTELI